MINYDFGDIVLVDFPFSGTRQRKKRPALVILDVEDRDVVLAPITSAKRSGVGDYKLQDWSTGGLLKISCDSKIWGQVLQSYIRYDAKKGDV